MELSSDRVLASLEMSQSKEDESSDGGANYESLPPHVSVATHMTAGAVAGVLEHTVMYPVDSVKVTPRARTTARARPLVSSAPGSSRTRSLFGGL